jgi:hypothetical protein
MMAGKSRHNQDAKLIELLGRGTTQAEAGRLTGMSARTVSRRLDDPAFSGQVERFRAGLLEAATGRLADLADAALDSLKSLLDERNPATVRIQAVKCVLESTLRFRDSLMIERRLSELEKLVSQEEANR